MRARGFWSMRSLVALLVLMSGFGAIGGMAQPAGAVVGAYLELHVLACPPGYDGSALFEDCHDNRVAGITFIAEGVGGERYEVVSDADGVAFFNDFYTTGPLTIIEKYPSGDYIGFQLYCTTTGDQTALPVTNSSNGRAAGSFDLPQSVIDAGTGVVCDWYYFVPLNGGMTVEDPSVGLQLGATIDQWNEIVGAGAPSGLFVVYKEGTIAARFETGRLVQVELDWLREGARTLEEASLEILPYLPGDATLIEQYQRPGIPGWTPGIIADRYSSTALAERLAGQPLLWTGNFVVIYETLEPAAESPLDPLLIVRVSIVAGNAM